MSPIEPWLEFVQQPGDPRAQAPFKTFLTTCLDLSKRQEVVLGSQEVEARRTLNSAHSVTEIWRRLVAAAEYHVMQPQRKGNPADANIWRIRWIHKDEGHREGPAYRIVRWIFLDLAIAKGLDTKPKYDKVEMTSTDIARVIRTLWIRANAIPCEPITRVSFHAILQLAGVGGFRPGTLENLRYRQFEVQVLRHPKEWTRSQVVITISINRNKIKERSKTSRLRDGTCITFSITFVPTSMFCLASLILARALQDNAFRAGYRTIDEVLDTPDMGLANWVPLRWKTEFEEECIFPISYQQRASLWNRCVLVSGARESPRFYSLRVGSVARMDGVLSNALRNYVLSHTTSVFESSYQAQHVRADLMSLAFGDDGGRQEELFSMLRNTSTAWDDRAPVEITTEEEHSFESRFDVTQIRQALSHAAESTERKRLQSKLTSVLSTLRRLKLEEKRREYFERVDYLRSSGTAPEKDSYHLMSNIGHTTTQERRVSSFLKVAADSKEVQAEHNPRPYVSAVFDYLLQKAPIFTDRTSDQNPSDTTKVTPSRCLLCSKNYSDRSALTKHSNSAHSDKTFSRPFPCPECLSTHKTVLISSASDWSNHTERLHGKANAPRWRGSATSQCCLICGKMVNNLIRHINNHRVSSTSNWPITCKICPGSSKMRIQGFPELLQHFQVHKETAKPCCALCGVLSTTESGLSRHITATHFFEKPFYCPLCVSQPLKGPTIINCRSSWSAHIHAQHGELNSGNSMPGLVDGDRRQTQIEEPGSQREKANGGDGDDYFQASMELDKFSADRSETDNCGSRKNADDDDCVMSEYSGYGHHADPKPDPSTSRESFEPQPPLGANFPQLADLMKSDEHATAFDLSKMSANDSDTNQPTFVRSSSVPLDMIDPVLRTGLHATDYMEGASLTTSPPKPSSLSGRDSMNSDIVIDPRYDQDEHRVDCILERWRKNTFLLRWLDDGSCWWVSRKDIDGELVKTFEETYRGLKDGVTVLRTRKTKGKTEYRVRWTGRPEGEDTWVPERHLSPDLLAKYRTPGKKLRRRKRH